MINTCIHLCCWIATEYGHMFVYIAYIRVHPHTRLYYVTHMWSWSLSLACGVCVASSSRFHRFVFSSRWYLVKNREQRRKRQRNDHITKRNCITVSFTRKCKNAERLVQSFQKTILRTQRRWCFWLLYYKVGTFGSTHSIALKQIDNKIETHKTQSFRLPRGSICVEIVEPAFQLSVL